MSEELKTAIYTAVEISVFALLVFIIAFFGGYAKDALDIKNSQDVSISELNEYRELYEIDKGKRIDVTQMGLTNRQYNRLKVTHSSGSSYDNMVLKYDSFIGDENSNIIKGEDILNYMLKKGGKYDIIIKFGNPSFFDVFKTEGTSDFTDLLQKYNLGENENANAVFLYSPGLKIRIKPEAQNANVVSFLREQMGMFITSDFYCSSIYDSTDNTYMAIVFHLI
jgi:hypothetical protein